jgi:hypothetical protein
MHSGACIKLSESEIQGRFRKRLLRHMVNIIMTFMKPVEVWTVRRLHVQENMGWDVDMALRTIYIQGDYKRNDGL